MIVTDGNTIKVLMQILDNKKYHYGFRILIIDVIVFVNILCK